MPDQMEIFINEQRADIAFFRILLTIFMLRVIAANPDGAEERLQSLKKSAMDAIGRMPADQAKAGEVRWKGMVEMRGSKFFAELEILIGQAQAIYSGEQPKN